MEAERLRLPQNKSFFQVLLSFWSKQCLCPNFVLFDAQAEKFGSPLLMEIRLLVVLLCEETSCLPTALRDQKETEGWPERFSHTTTERNSVSTEQASSLFASSETSLISLERLLHVEFQDYNRADLKFLRVLRNVKGCQKWQWAQRDWSQMSILSSSRLWEADTKFVCYFLNGVKSVQSSGNFWSAFSDLLL